MKENYYFIIGPGFLMLFILFIMAKFLKEPVKSTNKTAIMAIYSGSSIVSLSLTLVLGEMPKFVPIPDLVLSERNCAVITLLVCAGVATVVWPDFFKAWAKCFIDSLNDVPSNKR